MHLPVLLDEVLAAMAQARRPVAKVLDATFGRGGHTRALLQTYPGAKVWALDRDQDALNFAKNEFRTEIESERLHLVRGSFAQLMEMQDLSLVPRELDLILADLGVSSPQLDQATRGFSFYQDGPLDMRMDQSQEFKASDVVNTYDEDELYRVFREYGEVSKPARVVRAILHDRKDKPFETTQQLAGMIERVDGWRKKGQHPATQYFLALRLEVNQELTQVSEAVPQMLQSLAEGGVLVVLTFHSLEDRIVKNIFKSQLNHGKLLNKKVIVASDDETARNPRARSAKLRAFLRGQSESASTGTETIF